MQMTAADEQDRAQVGQLAQSLQQVTADLVAATFDDQVLFVRHLLGKDVAIR